MDILKTKSWIMLVVDVLEHDLMLVQLMSCQLMFTRMLIEELFEWMLSVPAVRS